MVKLDPKSKLCLYCKVQYNQIVPLKELKLKIDDIIILEYEDRFGDVQKTIQIPLVCPKCLMITNFVQSLKYQDG